ncbi:MAG TPA: TrkA C-terminal domain-containing protein [Mycobacteriales bacterium]|nr:TrkA C-terminal domain-containing protein [Mycobacteriales bacterium]
MVGIVSLLAILTLSIVITRVATVMLTATGLSRDIARFQARSAFSGAGFTTNESESVVNHPVRRRIVLQLMLLGAAGVVTSLTSLLLSFTGTTGAQTANRILVLVGGLVLLRLLAGSRLVDRALTRATEWGLRRYTRLNVRDYDKLLHISDDYTVAELDAEDGDWITGRPLGELRLRDEGVMVLGLYRRDGSYLGVPRMTTVVEPGDRLVLYGEDDAIPDLAARPPGPEGDALHERAVAAYRGKEGSGKPGSTA